MRPGPGVWHKPQTHDRETARPTTDNAQAEALVALSDEQRRLIEVLQAERHGMTSRQIEARLARSRGGVQLLLESLLERQLVARLNTLIPSYVYRYGGVDLNAE